MFKEVHEAEASIFSDDMQQDSSSADFLRTDDPTVCMSNMFSKFLYYEVKSKPVPEAAKKLWQAFHARRNDLENSKLVSDQALKWVAL